MFSPKPPGEKSRAQELVDQKAFQAQVKSRLAGRILFGGERWGEAVPLPQLRSPVDSKGWLQTNLQMRPGGWWHNSCKEPNPGALQMESKRRRFKPSKHFAWLLGLNNFLPTHGFSELNH